MQQSVPAAQPPVPVVVDLYHGDRVLGDRAGEPNGFVQAKAAGILGVIHKATQGSGVRDNLYVARRVMAKEAGLLWGAYHFNNGDHPAAQVDYFLQTAQPDANTLMILDFEDNTASEMSIEECGDFLDFADTRMGKKIAIYGGNRIREQLPKASAATQKFIGSHRLWLCQYGPVAKVPAPWASYFLWQFTGDGIGPQPHAVDGIPVNGVDLSTYGGTAEQLAAEWAA